MKSIVAAILVTCGVFFGSIAFLLVPQPTAADHDPPGPNEFCEAVYGTQYHLNLFSCEVEGCAHILFKPDILPESGALIAFPWESQCQAALVINWVIILVVIATGVFLFWRYFRGKKKRDKDKSVNNAVE